LHFVNWQRDISTSEINGKKVIVKKSKRAKAFHEYLLITSYTLISILLAHPSSPPLIGKQIMINEGFEVREFLEKIGIPTPKLVNISNLKIIEEYIDGGDLYKNLATHHGINTNLTYKAGTYSGRIHKAGYVFTDNKAQNYLVGTDGTLFRTDLGFIQKKSEIFARSMDIGSFLASVMDLSRAKYLVIEKEFHKGYRDETGSGFPYLSIILRNLLSLGFASEQKKMLNNMLIDSMKLITR